MLLKGRSITVVSLLSSGHCKHTRTLYVYNTLLSLLCNNLNDGVEIPIIRKTDYH